MFGKKKATGQLLIDDIANQFTSMIDDLEEGHGQCQGEIGGLEAQIMTMKARKAELFLSCDKADNLVRGLKKLIGEQCRWLTGCGKDKTDD